MIADKQAYPDMHFDSLGTSISKSYAFWICIFWAGPTLRKCAFFRGKMHIFCIFFVYSSKKWENLVILLDMHFGYAFLGLGQHWEICIFSRKNAHFLHIFCIFQQKVRKSGDFVGYAFWICIFGAGPTLRNVHFFEEKCIFFAYFLGHKHFGYAFWICIFGG